MVFRVPQFVFSKQFLEGMTLSIQRIAIESYIDVPFNLWLSVILILVSWCAIRNRVLLLLAVLSASTTIAVFDKTSTGGEMTKIMCELPLGLGSVLAFLVANRTFQIQYLPDLPTYITFAVY